MRKLMCTWASLNYTLAIYSMQGFMRLFTLLFNKTISSYAAARGASDSFTSTVRQEPS